VEVAQSAYIADPVIGTIQTGVVLDVRPIVSNDKKYITMELRPTIASLTRVRPFTTELGGATRSVTFEVPEIRLQSVESTVRIPDQGSLLIAGLKSFREIDRKLDIPVLGNIPIVSFFFSQTTKLDEKQDLIILVTGKIIDLEEEERKIFGTAK
jgi:type II secretory pathway component GspD/PulD (secretin)